MLTVWVCVCRYLRKVYGIRTLKINSMNYKGKLKRSTLRSGRGSKVYRTKAFKKFIGACCCCLASSVFLLTFSLVLSLFLSVCVCAVTYDPKASALPEQRAATDAIEAEIVRPVSAKV